MAEIPKEVRRLLDEHPWQDTVPRLILYAHRKVERLRWMGVLGGDPPEGWQPDDFVQTVFQKVYSGKRRWNPQEDSDLFNYLRSQLDSEISNRVRSLANRMLRTESTLPEDIPLDPPDQATTDQAILSAEQDREANDNFWRFYDELNDEPQLQKVGEAIFQGVKRAEMAQHLGVTVEQIDALRKRLDRRMRNYIKGRNSALSER